MCNQQCNASDVTGLNEHPNKDMTPPDPIVPIENRIVVIRRQKVILDADLAALYGVET